MAEMENIGGLRAEAEIDTSKFDESTKKLAKSVEQLNTPLKKTEEGLRKVEKASGEAAAGLGRTDRATEALQIGLGVLGAQSIQMVVQKMVQFTRESIQLAVNLRAVENRARAIYGSALPQMEREFAKLAATTRRSKSDLMEFGTGFANLMDSVGISGERLQTTSRELTQLTVTLGKAFPDKSDAEVYSIIEAGILGNTRGLRQLGIVMKDKQLQDFAERQGIRLKLKDMNEEQMMMLRTQFLLQETTKLQEAAALNAREGVDAGKQFAAVWQDFSETIGTVAMPVVNAFLSTMAQGIKASIILAGQLKAALLDAASFGMFSKWSGEKAALGVKQQEINANMALQFANEQRFRETGTFAAPPEPDFWANTGVGGGGGMDAAKEREKVLKDIEAAEKEILQALSEQAEQNRDRVEDLRDELKLKEEMGILTTQEAEQLRRINNRIEFQEDKIKDATDAWRDQKKAVEELKDEVETITEEIEEQQKQLKQTLADIDRDLERRKEDIRRDARRSREQGIADLLREQAELEDQLARGEGLSLKDQQRLQEIQGIITSARADTPEQFAEGQKMAGMTELELIDRETAQRLKDAEEEAKQAKIDAVVEANAELEESILKLADANLQLQTAEQALIEKKDAVIDAVDEMRVKNEANYAVIEENTRIHVQNQITELEKLRVKLLEVEQGYSRAGAFPAAAPAQQFASGGPVLGPGTGTSDSIFARLSAGEHVLTAAEVRAMGGHGSVFQFRSMLRDIPRFAEGGPVTHNNQRSATINITNHGRAAEVYANPRVARWHARRFLG